jgi:RNA polymerase sigma factor (sigma-70 family)
MHHNESSTHMDRLSDREYQIALMVSGRGLSDKEVARELGLSTGTVKVHMHKIRKKLGLKNRYGLFLWAMHGKTDPAAAAQ